jgi:hypothetical protein
MPVRNQLIACVIRQYGTGLYRAWVSLDERNAICLGPHQTEANATETIDRFLQAHQEGEIRSAEDVSVFIDTIHAKESVGAFSPMEQRVEKIAA